MLRAMITALVFLGGIAISVIAIKVFVRKNEEREQEQIYEPYQYNWMRSN